MLFDFSWGYENFRGVGWGGEKLGLWQLGLCQDSALLLSLCVTWYYGSHSAADHLDGCCGYSEGQRGQHPHKPTEPEQASVHMGQL